MEILQKFRLEGKTAIVTGGASRFGRPIARALCQAGAKVVLTSRSAAAAEEAAAALRREGGCALGLPLDLAGDDSIAALVQETARQFGGIDVLVHNAVERGNYAELEELNRDMVKKSAEVNLGGQIALVQAVLPYMKRQRGGSIVLLSSVSGLAAPKFSVLTPQRKSPANYAMEKWGVNGLARWLAAKYGKYNIRVNCLCPGTCDPSLFEDETAAQYVRNMEEYSPLARFMRAEEIAGPALFLASEASSFCTGVLLPVDGGFSI